MKVEIEIPEPDFKLEPNERLECRGFGWKGNSVKRFLKYYPSGKEWVYCSLGEMPVGKNNCLYFEIVEDFPMPPEELDGFKLEYVKSQDHERILEGNRYAVLVEGEWRIARFLYRRPLQSRSFHYALATPIEKKAQEVISDMENSIAGLQSELAELKKRVG